MSPVLYYQNDLIDLKFIAIYSDRQHSPTSYWKKKIREHLLHNIMLALSFLTIFILIVILIVNSDAGAVKLNTNDKNICLTPECVKEGKLLVWSISLIWKYWCVAARILRTIDESVSPCDDFYQFSCGKWIESTIIPEHKSSQSTFDDLQDDLNKKLRGISFLNILIIHSSTYLKLLYFNSFDRKEINWFEK